MRVNADPLLIRAAATSTSGTLNDLTTDLIMANNNNNNNRKMLSSVCLLPMSLVFHCSIWNVLSDMVGLWAGLGGGEGARGCGGILQAVQIQPLAL